MGHFTSIYIVMHVYNALIWLNLFQSVFIQYAAYLFSKELLDRQHEKKFRFLFDLDLNGGENLRYGKTTM